MKRSGALGRALLLAVVVLAGSARAVEPAGGAPETEVGADAPDASVLESTSYLRDGSDAASAQSDDGPRFGLMLLALGLLLGLGGAAFWLQRGRFAHKTAPRSDARLEVLASSRIGPKAFAVTARVGGRMLLLGVTDQTVTHLGWLEPEAAPKLELADDSDELPDDYPGSLLRAKARAAANGNAAEGDAPTTQASLLRFQEVLRDAAERRGDGDGDVTPDPASVLAERTRDVLGALPAPVGETRAASVRRKRARKLPALPKADAPEPDVEGQAAGLKALKKT